MQHVELVDLEAGVARIRGAPKDAGAIELMVRRPAEGERELLDEAELDAVQGLVGDGWHMRGSRATGDGSAHPDLQLTLMNARVTALVAQTRERWALAGDQLYVDLDLSEANLPAGTRLVVGSAVIEITAIPHTGCGKFARRFGVDALKFVNSNIGRELNMRGRNARIITGGTVRTGDQIRKLPVAA
jgi:MOSC domain-containing protein YiiM